jgi:hypothetical protein
VFVGCSDHVVHELNHLLVGYMGGDALYGNVVVAPIDVFLQAFILVGGAEVD